MACAKGCCPTQAEHYRSLTVRTGQPKTKVTVDHTDDTINTVTEHWHDRQDVHVQVLEPVRTSNALPRRTDGEQA